MGFLLVPLAVGGSGWLLLNVVPDNAPDAQELRSLQIRYEFTENYHYAKIERDYVDPVESFLAENKETFKIDQVFSSFGNNNASTEIYLHVDEIGQEEMEDIRGKISAGLPVIPGCRIELSGASGRQNREGIGVSLYGDDPQVLEGLLKEARARLRKHPDFSQVSSTRDSTREEVQIRLRRDLARRYGVSTQSVSEILGILMRGRQVRGFRTSEGEVDVIIRLRPEDRSGLEDLRSAVVGYGDEGEEVLLSHVADLRIEKVAAQIQREDRQTFANFFATYSGDKRDEGIEQVKAVMDGLDYPAGYGWSLGFWTRRNQQSDQEWVFNILLALFMVYFVMASLFESLTHPLAIMLSLPFAVVGIAGLSAHHRNTLQPDGQDRNPGAHRNRGEQRHRPPRPDQHPAPPGGRPPPRHSGGMPGSLSTHRDDGDHHGCGPDSTGLQLQQLFRHSVLSHGPHRHGRTHRLHGADSGGAAHLLHPLRRPDPVAETELAIQRPVRVERRERRLTGAASGQCSEDWKSRDRAALQSESALRTPLRIGPEDGLLDHRSLAKPFHSVSLK